MQAVYAGGSIVGSHGECKQLFSSANSSRGRTGDADVLLSLGDLACRVSLFVPSLAGGEAQSLLPTRRVGVVAEIERCVERVVFVGELVSEVACVTPETEVRVGLERRPATAAALLVEGAGSRVGTAGAVS